MKMLEIKDENIRNKGWIREKYLSPMSSFCHFVVF